MITSRLFRKNFLILCGLVLLFIVLGSMTSHLIMRFSEMNESEERIRPSILSFYARVIDEVSPQDPIVGLQKVESWKSSPFPTKLLLINADGKVIFPEKESLSFDWNKIEKPTKVYSEVKTFPPNVRRFPDLELVKLEREPIMYVAMKIDHPRNWGGFGPPPPAMRNGPPPPMFFVTFGSLLVSVFLGVGFALFFILRSVKAKAKIADEVISELQKGNLKARFPIKKHDEFGEAMTRFNTMADEIENLVDRLKSAEHSRMTLLQELAHDLRTPVASLKHLIETVHDDGDALQVSVRKELLGLALKETVYFEYLVEDLLVLAQVSEPRYRPEQKVIDLRDLIEDEVDRAKIQFRDSEQKNIEVEIKFSSDSTNFTGDPNLLRRMVRNLLENALSYARSKVQVELTRAGPEVHLIVRDDGEGFSADALKNYGERRITRVLDTKATTKKKRLSVGLGSVIIKTVAQIHRGNIQIKNDGTPIMPGAEVTIRLKNF